MYFVLNFFKNHPCIVCRILFWVKFLFKNPKFILECPEPDRISEIGICGKFFVSRNGSLRFLIWIKFGRKILIWSWLHEKLLVWNFSSTVPIFSRISINDYETMYLFFSTCYCTLLCTFCDVWVYISRHTWLSNRWIMKFEIYVTQYSSCIANIKRVYSHEKYLIHR